MYYVLSITVSFFGGAECSRGDNPLKRLTENGKSLQRDIIVGQGSGNLPESFRAQEDRLKKDDVCSIA